MCMGCSVNEMKLVCDGKKSEDALWSVRGVSMARVRMRGLKNC